MADRENLEKRLLKAASAEEIKAIAAEDGFEMTDEEAQRVFGKYTVSVDELETMNGGDTVNSSCTSFTYRSLFSEGCAATVEEDSNCWGTDGGCYYFNVRYLS